MAYTSAVAAAPGDDRRPEVGLTDQELIDEFVAVVQRDETTRHKYARFLEEFAAWLAARGLSLITARRADVVRFLAYLASEKRIARNSRGALVQKRLGASSRKGALCALRAFYKHCSVMEYLDRDATFGIETPKVAIKRGLTINRAQLRGFLDARGRERCRVQAYLFVYTAARLASIASLRWCDVDLAGGVIHLDTAKGDEGYSLPLHPQLRAALLRWRSAQLEQADRNPAIARALEDEETAFVLLTSTGRPVSKTTLGKQIKWRAKRAAILTHAVCPDKAGENKSALHTHAIRRSIATLLRKDGKSLEDIADLLNHKDMNVTRTHYAFTDTPEKRKTINGLDF